MHPQIQKLVDKLQWHASVEAETLDEEFCQSLNPREILHSARRAGLSFDDARKDIISLRDAKIGDSDDPHAEPLLARSAFRLFSAAVWSAFKEDSSDACEPDAAIGDDAETNKNAKGKKATNKPPAGKSDAPKTPKGKKRQKSGEDTAVVPPQEPQGSPSGKARSTRSRISFKDQHVQHVAEQAASPHPDTNANVDNEAAEEAPSQPAKGRKRAKTVPQPATKVAKGAAQTAAEKSTEAKDSVADTPRRRAKMLSEVQNAPVADEDAGKPASKSQAAKGSKGGTASKSGAKSLAQLADSLAGGSSGADAPQSSKKKKRGQKEDATAENPSKKLRKGAAAAAKEGKAAEAKTGGKKTRAAGAGDTKQTGKGQKADDQATTSKGKSKKVANEKGDKEGAAAADGADDGSADDEHNDVLVEDSTLPGANEAPPAGEVIPSRLPPEQLSLLLQVYNFLHETRDLLAMDHIPSLQDLEASLFSTSLCNFRHAASKGSRPEASAQPTDTQAASSAPFVAAVVPLLQLLASDIYSAVMQQYIDHDGVAATQEKDLNEGEPVVEEENWQHICSGIFAGVALGHYLSQSSNPGYKRFKPAGNLSGLPSMLDPQLWIYFLNGAFASTGSLRPDAALLPQCADDVELEDCIECLMHWQSAEATLQAEDMLAAGLGNAGSAHGTARAEKSLTSTQLLDRLCGALDEHVCNTLLTDKGSVAAAARVGRPGSLLRLFASSCVGVYDKHLDASESQVPELHSHMSVPVGDPSDFLSDMVNWPMPKVLRPLLPSFSLSNQGAPYGVAWITPRRSETWNTGLIRVTNEVEDMMGVLQAAEKRAIVPLQDDPPEDPMALSTALFEAFDKTSQAAQEHFSSAARINPDSGSLGPNEAAAAGGAADALASDSTLKTDGRRKKAIEMSDRLLAVVSEAEQEMVRNILATSEEQATLRLEGTSNGVANSCGAHSDDMEGFESFAHMLNGSSNQDISPEDWLSILHALVVLASESMSVRAVLRSGYDMLENLRNERRHLRKEMIKSQKQIRQQNKPPKKAAKDPKKTGSATEAAPDKTEADKAAGEQTKPKQTSKKAASGSEAAPKKAEAIKKEIIYTRSQGENPKDKLARDRTRLEAVDIQLQTVQVKMSPHLGQDRQHNDFWCLEQSGDEGHSKQLVVLCQEYSHGSSKSKRSESKGESTSTSKRLLFCEGAAAAQPDVGLGHWMLYKTPEAVVTLMEWLHSNGEREHALKERLQGVHSAMLTLNAAHDTVPPKSAANTSNGAAPKASCSNSKDSRPQRPQRDSAQPPATAQNTNEPDTQANKDDNAADEEPEDVADEENMGGNANMSATTSMPESTGAAKAKEPRTPATDAEAGSPQSLGQELLAIEQALKDTSAGDCYMNTWDGDKRSQWRSFVATATGLAQHQVSPPLAVQPAAATDPSVVPSEEQQAQPNPAQAMAALIVLEGIVRSPWLRTFWRLWSLPQPQPSTVCTWAAVWHRLLALRRALRFNAGSVQLRLFERKEQRQRSCRQAANMIVTQAETRGAARKRQEGPRKPQMSQAERQRAARAARAAERNGSLAVSNNAAGPSGNSGPVDVDTDSRAAGDSGEAADAAAAAPASEEKQDLNTHDAADDPVQGPQGGRRRSINEVAELPTVPAIPAHGKDE